MLDETLVIWGGVFGRTPLFQGLDMRLTGVEPARVLTEALS